jgi:hypothetical protein
VKIESIKNVTTTSSPVTYQVVLRVNVHDLKDDDTSRQIFRQDLANAVIRTVEGIE